MKLTEKTTPQARNYQCNKCKSIKCHKDMIDYLKQRLEEIAEGCGEEQQGHKCGFCKKREMFYLCSICKARHKEVFNALKLAEEECYNYPKSAVREFIRRLKEEIFFSGIQWTDKSCLEIIDKVIEIIDKMAGDL